MGRIKDDLYIDGTLSCKTFTPPSACIPGSALTPAAAIAANQYTQRKTLMWCQKSSEAATSQIVVLHTVVGATAVVKAFGAGMQAANTGTATVSFQLLKGLTNALTQAVTCKTCATLTNQAGTISVTTSVAGNVFRAKLTIAQGAGGIGKGPYCYLIIDEEPVSY